MPLAHQIVCMLAIAFVSILGCGETKDMPGGSGGGAGTGGSAGGGGTAGTAGTGATAGGGGFGGTGGMGGGSDLCAGVDCSDANECTIDPTCSPATGECEGGDTEPLDTSCGGGSYFCDGLGRCVECNRDGQCPDDGNPCANPFCDGSACVDVEVGGSCAYMGETGVCKNGACVSANLCNPYPCENRGACVADHCDPATGACSYQYLPIHTRCLSSGGRYCDGNGRCIQCNNDPQCDDLNACTSDTCITGPLPIPQCLHQSLADGSNCAGSGTACIDGQCQADPLDRESFSGRSGTLASGIWTWWPARDWLQYEFYPYGLAAFYFNFTGAGVDHELAQVRAGFYLEEYLPNISGMETAGWALYEDQNGDDPYNWEIDAQRLPVGSTQHQLGDCTEWSATFNKEVGSAPPGYVPALLGFNLDRATDYNVEEVQVRLFDSTGKLYLSIYFTEGSGNHPICYSVSYALIPSHRIRVRGYSFSRSGGGSDTEPIDAQRPILQGFDMHYGFASGDHHVDEFGVRLTPGQPGQIRVWLNDQNDDDPFYWTVWWVDLE
jgi:hypothetical protein